MGEPTASHFRLHLPFLTVLAVAIVLSVACEGVTASGADPDGGATVVPATETPNARATAMPTVATIPPADVERDGPAGLREFAHQVQAAFDGHDSAFLIQRMKGTNVPCTPADLGRKGPEGRPLCAADGTYRGFLTGRWRSEWETIPLEEALQSLTEIAESAEPSAQDMTGSGQLQIHALNVAPGEYRIIATALALRPKADPHVGPTRVAFSLTVAFESGRWRFTSLLTATVLAEDLLRPGTEFTARLTGWEPYPH